MNITNVINYNPSLTHVKVLSHTGNQYINIDKSKATCMPYLWLISKLVQLCTLFYRTTLPLVEGMSTAEMLGYALDISPTIVTSGNNLV